MAQSKTDALTSPAPVPLEYGPACEGGGSGGGSEMGSGRRQSGPRSEQLGRAAR